MKDNLTGLCLRRTLRENRGKAAALALSVACSVLFSLVPPQLLRRIVDGNLTPRTTAGLLPLAAAYLGALVLANLSDFCKGGLLTIFGQKLVRRMRSYMMEKLTRLAAAYFTKGSPGAISSRFLNDVDNVSSLFTEGVVSMAIDCLKVIGILVSIALFSWRLGLATLVLVPVVFFLTRHFKRRSLSAQIRNLEQLGQVNNHIAESLSGVHTVKTYHREGWMEGLYRRYLLENYRTMNRVNFYDALYSPIIQILRALVILFIVMTSSAQWNFLGISLGTVAASIELISNLFAPIENLGMELQNVQKGISGIQRINDFYREAEEPPKNADLTAQRILGGQRAAALRFDHVTFAYEPGHPVLRDIDLTVPAGASVTFAGRTGVGKTTLFKLIAGLLRPTEGRITLGGADAADIPSGEKRRIYGYVEQSFRFVEGSVLDQITLGDPAITREDAQRALRFVELWDDVAALPQGPDTIVTSGAGFSQGQKQLLAIARAIAADPAVLLLDEITANLDSATESRVVTILQKATAGRTVLSVSHRLTSMLNSDTIVFLEDGRVRSQGTPRDLMENDPWFRSRLQLERSAWDA
jgi:ATP-binding cassette subfamily B protein